MLLGGYYFGLPQVQPGPRRLERQQRRIEKQRAKAKSSARKMKKTLAKIKSKAAKREEAEQQLLKCINHKETFAGKMDNIESQVQDGNFLLNINNFYNMNSCDILLYIEFGLRSLATILRDNQDGGKNKNSAGEFLKFFKQEASPENFNRLGVGFADLLLKNSDRGWFAQLLQNTAYHKVLYDYINKSDCLRAAIYMVAKGCDSDDRVEDFNEIVPDKLKFVVKNK